MPGSENRLLGLELLGELEEWLKGHPNQDEWTEEERLGVLAHIGIVRGVLGFPSGKPNLRRK